MILLFMIIVCHTGWFLQLRMLSVYHWTASLRAMKTMNYVKIKLYGTIRLSNPFIHSRTQFASYALYHTINLHIFHIDLFAHYMNKVYDVLIHAFIHMPVTLNCSNRIDESTNVLAFYHDFFVYFSANKYKFQKKTKKSTKHSLIRSICVCMLLLNLHIFRMGRCERIYLHITYLCKFQFRIK